MNDSFYFTKRWFAFFLLYVLVWYPVSFLLVSAYQATAHPAVYVAVNIFTPLWTLLVSYLYFRRAQNNWSARFVTAFGWIILMFVVAIVLVRPVYGLGWSSILNWGVINANWINVVAIIVGAIAAARPKRDLSKTR